MTRFTGFEQDQGGPSRHPGPFVCILGGDGSGKSTLIKRLKKLRPTWAFAHWKQFSAVTQLSSIAPGLDPPETLKILGPNARAAQLCYLAALEYDAIVSPAIMARRPVIVDSFWFKFAAKMKVLDMAAPFLYEVCLGLPNPALILFLDTPLALAKARKASINFFECGGIPKDFIAFQAAIRQVMLGFVAQLPMVKLDGSLPIENLADLAIKHISPVFESAP